MLCTGRVPAAGIRPAKCDVISSADSCTLDRAECVRYRLLFLFFSARTGDRRVGGKSEEEARGGSRENRDLYS